MIWRRGFNLFILALLGFLPAFARAGDGVSNNVAYLLSDPRESISSRVNLIAQSQRPLLTVFEIAEDDIGLAQLSALVDSARSGGKPRLLVDAVGTHLSRESLSYLASQNVEVRIFRALSVRPILQYRTTQLLQRMHDKVLTDGAGTVITGGRNSRNPYFGLDPQGRNFLDYDVVLTGPAGDAARAYQEQLWSSPMSQPVALRGISASDATAQELKFSQAVAHLKNSGWIKTPVFSFVNLLLPVQAAFVHDDVTANGQRQGAEKALLSLLAQARREVLIDSQFLLLTPDIYSALKETVARGVAVTIVTNGQTAYQVGADRLTQEAFELSKPTLSLLGITVREFEGPGKIHSKEVEADDSNCLIWSFNLDPRSRFINFESGLRITSPALCGKLAASMRVHIGQSQLTISGGHEILPQRTISREQQTLIKTVYKEL